MFFDTLLYIDRQSFLTTKDNYVYKRSSIRTNGQQEYSEIYRLYKHRIF